MPSSISSSETGELVRAIPTGRWLARFASACLAAFALVAAWEQHVRALGYGPSFEDVPNLWAKHRAAARHATREQIVFVGSSRTLFDIDLETFQTAIGGPLPIQLATVGSNPRFMLASLAADESYAGTTIVGVAPGLIAAGGGPPVSTPQRFVQHYDTWSPADRVELPLAMWLQERLAFINQDDLALQALIDEGLALPNRDRVYAPNMPPYGYHLDRHRRARMIDRLANDPEQRHRLQQIWLGLCAAPPKPDVFSDEQWADMMRQGWEDNLASLRDSVTKIRARGGEVVFVRHPSTGELREIERREYPRAEYWERILTATNSRGVHFEDEPELRDFDCPEWSHLSAPDSVEYSRRLVEIMLARGMLSRAVSGD